MCAYIYILYNMCMYIIIWFMCSGVASTRLVGAIHRTIPLFETITLLSCCLSVNMVVVLLTD